MNTDGGEAMAMPAWKISGQYYETRDVGSNDDRYDGAIGSTDDPPVCCFPG